MLDKLDADARQLHESASQAHQRALQIDRIEAELAVKSARKLVSRGDKGAAEATLAALAQENRDAPREPRLVVNDSTVEKLGELVLGRVPGRDAAGDVTIFKSLGMAVEDVVAADLVFRRASESGAGTELTL